MSRIDGGRLLPEDAPTDVEMRIGEWLGRQRNP
jgi:hypothetical protein